MSTKTKNLVKARALLASAMLDVHRMIKEENERIEQEKVAKSKKRRREKPVEITFFAQPGSNTRHYIDKIEKYSETSVVCPYCNSRNIEEMKVAINKDSIDVIAICRDCKEQCRVVHNNYIFSTEGWQIERK